MRNLDELFKGIKNEAEYAEKRNKEIQVLMLSEARSYFIRAGEREETSKEHIFLTGKAEGIVECLRKYFNYRFEDLMVGDTSMDLPTNFRIDMDKIQKAITKLSEGRITYVK